MKTMQPGRCIKYTKFGLGENPIGLKVSLSLNGRLLLGEVTAVTVRERDNAALLTVAHFNGSEWPIRPCAASVRVVS